MQNVGNADNSMFGMNTHMEGSPTPHLTEDVQVLSQCGVKWIRAWWGWGMCEATQGTFDFTEFDRQFNTTTTGTGMRIMPILLRYYSQYEQSWAGPVDSGGIQEYPFTNMLPEWGVFCGKVAQQYQGQVKAYEIWNEPTMGAGTGGVQTSAQYAVLLNYAAPAIRQYDPAAKVVAFAGVPLTFMRDTLADPNIPLSSVDVISEHAYSQILLPEFNYPKQIATGSPLNVKGVMATGGAGSKLIWHSEQGISAEGDGYTLPSISEADVAQLYVRNIVTAASLTTTAQGTSSKFFWFDDDTTPRSGYAVFFGDYVPRPRLAALNACASFLEGLAYQKSYNPSNTRFYAHLFQGTASAVAVVWNSASRANLNLPISPAKLLAFDTMGNPVAVAAVGTNSVIQLPQERPTYLQCAAGDYNLLDAALTGMQGTSLSPITVTARSVTGGVQVTVTGALSNLVDGIVNLIPAAPQNPVGWPRRSTSSRWGPARTPP